MSRIRRLRRFLLSTACRPPMDLAACENAALHRARLIEAVRQKQAAGRGELVIH